MLSLSKYVYASIILVYGNSSPIYPVCTSSGVIANLIPKIIIFSSFVSTLIFESIGFHYFIQLPTDDPSFIDRLIFPQKSCDPFSPSSKSDNSVNGTMASTTCDTVSIQHRALSGVSCLCPSVE